MTCHKTYWKSQVVFYHKILKRSLEWGIFFYMELGPCSSFLVTFVCFLEFITTVASEMLHKGHGVSLSKKRMEEACSWGQAANGGEACTLLVKGGARSL